MRDVTELVDRYVGMWNEPDPLARAGCRSFCESSVGGQPPHKGETPDPEVSVPSVQE